MSETVMIFIDVAARMARQRGYKVSVMNDWLCFDKDDWPVGRCMITDDQVSRYAFDMITEARSA
jgi:hypothetical protein